MYLIWESESDRPATSVLELGTEPIRIGRGTMCDIRINDSAKGVSRVHCVIQKEGEHWRLLDYSTNGTFVNGRQTQEQILNDGDQIIVGPVTIAFSAKPPRSDSRAASSRSPLGDDTRSYTAILRNTPPIRNPYQSGKRKDNP